MSDIFISYARADSEAARFLAERLATAGFSVFFDSEGIVVGEDWSNEIETELQKARAILVLLSSHSLRSRWVQEEIQIALEQKTLVIPILLDDSATENWVWPLLSTRQSIRLDRSSTDAAAQLDSLVRVLEQIRLDDGEVGVPLATASSPDSSPARSRRWFTVVIALVSASIGGLIVLLLR